jgi:hypothetical protein
MLKFDSLSDQNAQGGRKQGRGKRKENLTENNEGVVAGK